MRNSRRTTRSNLTRGVRQRDYRSLPSVATLRSLYGSIYDSTTSRLEKIDRYGHREASETAIVNSHRTAKKINRRVETIPLCKRGRGSSHSGTVNIPLYLCGPCHLERTPSSCNFFGDTGCACARGWVVFRGFPSDR